ncbi:hypothetical protein GN956_G12017 [Arapaima gigas]
MFWGGLRTCFAVENPEDISPFRRALIQSSAENGSGTKRPCLLPPINYSLGKTKDRKEPDHAAPREEQRRQEEMCLLAELVRIEQELRERLRWEKERQELQEQVRQEENRQCWRNFCYMSLSQRINKYV